MEEKCCAFTGHRPDRFSFRYDEADPHCKKIKAELMRQAEGVYQDGVRQYWFGGALGVDLWAAEAVICLKQQYKNISLCCAIPFHGYNDPWRGESKKRLARILSFCDRVVTVGRHYRPDAYKWRNYFMIDRCQTLIAVFDQDRGIRSSTLQTVNYAKKLGRQIILIHPDTAKLLMLP